MTTSFQIFFQLQAAPASPAASGRIGQHRAASGSIGPIKAGPFRAAAHRQG